MNKDQIMLLNQLNADLSLFKKEIEQGDLDGYMIVCHFRADGENESVVYGSSLHASTLLGFVEVAKARLVNQLTDRVVDSGQVSADVLETLKKNETNPKLN